jgi:hypothetical protein
MLNKNLQLLKRYKTIVYLISFIAFFLFTLLPRELNVRHIYEPVATVSSKMKKKLPVSASRAILFEKKCLPFTDFVRNLNNS